MLKRITAVCLSIVLMLVMAVPALAAGESLDAELARVTKAVKETLGIGDSYTKFDGNVSDRNSYRTWNLDWSAEDETLSVTADTNGKIFSYYRYKNRYDKDQYGYGYSPAFPKVSRSDAQAAAKAFVEKLLKTGETIVFEDNEIITYEIRNSSTYYFYGTILLNGIKSPLSFNVGVIADGLYINNFSRSDLNERFVPDIPSPVASVSSEKASALLAGNVKMKLQYVLEDEKKPAVLRYLPVYTGNYIVRADTGAVVNLDELQNLYSTAYASARGMGGAEKSADSNGLSEVELSAVSDLEGVLSKEKLDEALRSINGLGLENGYTLRSVNYWKDSESDVFCRLTYTKKLSENSEKLKSGTTSDAASSKYIDTYPQYSYKYIMVDAKTAALKSISSSSTFVSEEAPVLSASQLEQKALLFIKTNFNDKYSRIVLNKEDSSPENGHFVFSETANGIPFTYNYVSISVDTSDGTVMGLDINWKDDVQFASAEGIVSADAALAAYTASFKPVLQYVYIPAGEDQEGYKLVLAYKFESEKYVSGVDAKTGEVIAPVYDTNTAPLSYDDLEGCYGKAQIEALAKYKVGFAGPSFKPEAQLTQKDALVLLLSAVGYGFDMEEDYLYESAYSYKLITRKEKDPGKLLNRADLIKILVGATEYGPAAELKGIFNPGFSDDALITDEYRGYAAIAKSLGIVKGDEENKLNPLDSVSRQDAAIMLYNFMSR